MILSTTEPLCIARDPATLQDLWSELARRRARPTLFLTPEWIAVARSGDRRAQITLSIDQSRGIAALARDDDGTIAFAGGEYTDEKDVVAAPGDARAVAEALGRWIAEERAPRALLSDVPESAPTADGLAPSLAARGWLRLGLLRVDGDDAAVLFAFAYEGTLSLYNAAYDPALAGLSVGIVAHANAIRSAIADGLHTYDLLRGDEPYKYDLGADDHWLLRVEATRR